MAGPLGRDHDHIEIRARLNAAEMDIEAVRERECRTLLDVGLDLTLI